MYLSRVTLKPDIANNSQLGKLLSKRTYGVHQLLWDLFDQSRRDFLYREEIAREQLDRPGVKSEPVYYLLSAKPPKTDTPLFSVQSKPFEPHFAEGQRLSFRLRANPVVTRSKCRYDLVMDEQLAFCRQLCGMLGLPRAGKKRELLQRLLQPEHAAPLREWLRDFLRQSRYFAEVDRGHKVDELLGLAMREAVSRRLIDWLTQNPSREGIFSLATRQAEDENSGETLDVTAFEWHGYRNHPLPEKNPEACFRSVDLSGQLIVHDPQRFQALILQGVGPAKGFGCGLMLVRPVQFG